ncbi:hypothetical protein SteCoe_39648 [Stentor coeruleus]|uniref:Uncharacterized protein n=1 Tax=Stentor coeruleus TaxID=5963 RepID=A0A1R2AKK7_9CILI|nr:hypothetical protein SteCoe_39648 [Stentor coeruleus]
MPNLTLNNIKFGMLPIGALGISIIAVGGLGYDHDECGPYIPAWLIVAGISFIFFAFIYSLSVHYSGRDKSLTICYAVLSGILVLFNIFLLIVGDYAFSQLGSSCSTKKYGSGKSRYIPYTSTLVEIIIFNIFTVVGIYYWFCLVFTYKNEGIHYYKKQEKVNTDEVNQHKANKNANSVEDHNNMIHNEPDQVQP